MTSISEKIQALKSGDIVNFINYDEGLEYKNQNIERVTEKALLINGHWFPKSQIVHFDAITKDLLFNAWFANKKTQDAWKNRQGGAY
tara:strand:- start:53 stop:313 length:261 start_codon:yes stop_codon:yes gene_type:complete